MNEDEEIREKPDTEDLEWMSKLRRQLVQLKLKHGRRKRSPLKFVEAYEELERDLGEYSSCLPVRTLVEQMKKELGWLKNDYELKLIPAEEQAKRNELWDSIYRPLPRILNGGSSRWERALMISSQPVLSLVIPCYDEEENLHKLHKAIARPCQLI